MKLSLLRRTVLTSFAFGYLALTSNAIQAAALTISQQPLFLNETVDPNILVTLDDSGSMAFAYAPDSIESNKSKDYFKSNVYNPMYYNPNIIYKVPKKVTVSNGNLQVTDYPTPSFTSAWKNGFTQSGSINLSKSYKATVEYGRGYDEDTGTAQAAYYYDYTPGGSGCKTGSLTNESCYTKAVVPSSQQTNFAIWFSFYRTRALATQSAANLAFYSLPENVRVTWQVLNNSSCDSIGEGNSKCYSNYLRPFSGNHRANFFSFLENLSVTGGTPLRVAVQRAGEFLRRKDVNGPYAAVPGTSIGTEYTCRPSYSIVMTDGLWNGDKVSVGDTDSSSTSLPDGITYNSRPPYKDGTSNTLADLTFYYWATDARSDLANNLAPYSPYKDSDATKQYFDPRNDPATWQHLVTYTLGLGLTTSLTDPKWGGSTYTGDYAALARGDKTWPKAADNSANNVYDLWHAAINGRGEFFSADSPEAMTNAFSTILSRISDRDTSASAVSLESAVTTAGNEAYYARFSSQNWSGQLIKYEINDQSGALTPSWDARDLLNNRAASSRNIKFVQNNQLTDFNWSNLSSAQRLLFQKDDDGNTESTDTYAQRRVAYIRGDRTYEGTGSTDLRERNYVLGDIIYSSPVVVSKPDSLPSLMDRVSGATQTGSTQQKYAAFFSANQDRAKRIYVGANDGMLHGFDADGIERFAFIPTAVLNKLYLLSSQTYKGTKHRFYVDGTPVVSEIQIGKEWRTILVGSLRGGGRSVFALDITIPGQEKLLWEFSDNDDGDLGYTFSKPVVAKLHDGNWGVILTNGYNSTNDKAVLFVLNAVTGAVIKKLTPNTGNLVNGLSTPRVADINGDLIADYVYAGDLQGNLWRFDLFDPSLTSLEVIGSNGAVPTGSSAKWRVAFGGNPLYRATTTNTSGQTVAQPITAAPSLVRHPSGVGYIVDFGTGKYFESSDAQADSSKAMALYGIWDTQTSPVSGGATSTPSLSRSNLVQQTISTRTAGTFTDPDGSGRTQEYRLISRNPIQWYRNNNPAEGINKYGWYMDLKEGDTLKGEMITTDMTIRGNVLIFTSTIPNVDPCQPSIDRWIQVVDAVTGGSTSYDVIDLTGNNYVTAADSASGKVVSSIRMPGYGSPSVVGKDLYTNLPDGVSRTRITFGELARGRQNWRQIEDE